MKATNSLDGVGIRIVFVVSISVCLLVIVSQSYDKYFIATNFQALKSGALCFINVCADDNVANKNEDSSAEPSSPPTIAHLHNRSSDVRT